VKAHLKDNGKAMKQGSIIDATAIEALYFFSSLFLF